MQRNLIQIVFFDDNITALTNGGSFLDVKHYLRNLPEKSGVSFMHIDVEDVDSQSVVYTETVKVSVSEEEYQEIDPIKVQIPISGNLRIHSWFEDDDFLNVLLQPFPEDVVST